MGELGGFEQQDGKVPNVKIYKVLGLCRRQFRISPVSNWAGCEEREDANRG